MTDVATIMAGAADDAAIRQNSTFCVLFQEFDSVADGQDGLGGVEIVDEARILGDLVGFDPEVLHDDFLHSLANVTHLSNLVRCGNGPDPTRDVKSSRRGLVVVDGGRTHPGRGWFHQPHIFRVAQPSGGSVIILHSA
jgi:hypothetical protein